MAETGSVGCFAHKLLGLRAYPERQDCRSDGRNRETYQDRANQKDGNADDEKDSVGLVARTPKA